MIYHWVYAKWSRIYYVAPENSCKLFLGMQNGIVGVQSVLVIIVFIENWKVKCGTFIVSTLISAVYLHDWSDPQYPALLAGGFIYVGFSCFLFQGRGEHLENYL